MLGALLAPTALLPAAAMRAPMVRMPPLAMRAPVVAMRAPAMLRTPSVVRAPLVAMQSSSAPRPVALGALALYFGFFFLSPIPPGPNVLETPVSDFLDTVLSLSYNFFYVYPLAESLLSSVLPIATAPVNDPIYEAIFNVAIAHSLLFIGFAADGRKATDDASVGTNAFAPFLAAMPFATNLAYLAYLGTRSEPLQGPPKQPLNWLEELGEAPALPLSMLAVLALSLGWAVFARPEFGLPGTRPDLLATLLDSERLAYALLGDCAFFGLFQGWLLEDDLARRDPISPTEREALLRIGRYVPFVGLAYYLLRRPALATKAR